MSIATTIFRRTGAAPAFLLLFFFILLICVTSIKQAMCCCVLALFDFGVDTYRYSEQLLLKIVCTTAPEAKHILLRSPEEMVKPRQVAYLRRNTLKPRIPEAEAFVRACQVCQRKQLAGLRALLARISSERQVGRFLE